MAVNIFTRAKEYQKQHPRTSWADCIQKVKGKGKSTVSGVKKKRKAAVTGPVKRKPVKRASVGRAPATRSASNPYQKAMSIVSKIDRMEDKLKQTKGREARKVIQVFINKEHDKLDALTKKRRSA